jgi:hypothetical protein
VHFNKNRVLRAAIFGIGLTLTAALAMANEATFTLPFAAHVGNVTLNPGEYRISAPEVVNNVHVVYLYGDGKVKATMPASVGMNPESGRSYLELVNVGGVYFVQKYNAGLSGRTYSFEIPKKVRREALMNARATTLPVSNGATN